MPDEFDDLLRKALEEAEKLREEFREQAEVNRERFGPDYKDAVENYLQSERENIYFSVDPEDALDYPPEASRGLFFSLEDALEYAKDIPEGIPVLIIEKEDGYEVVVIYD